MSINSKKGMKLPFEITRGAVLALVMALFIISFATLFSGKIFGKGGAWENASEEIAEIFKPISKGGGSGLDIEFPSEIGPFVVENEKKGIEEIVKAINQCFAEAKARAGGKIKTKISCTKFCSEIEIDNLPDTLLKKRREGKLQVSIRKIYHPTKIKEKKVYNISSAIPRKGVNPAVLIEKIKDNVKCSEWLKNR